MRLRRARGAHAARAEHTTDTPTVVNPTRQRAQARDRFGGLDAQAAASGALAGLGCFAFLTALLLAALTTTPIPELTPGALADIAPLPAALGVVLALTISVRSAGWVAGRLARYDGARNGLAAGLGMVTLLALIGLLAGAFARLGTLSNPTGLPDPTAPGLGVVSLEILLPILALALVITAACFGGAAGARWHRRVDDVLLTPVPSSSTELALPYPAEDRAPVRAASAASAVSAEHADRPGEEHSAAEHAGEDHRAGPAPRQASARERLAERIPIPLPPPGRGDRDEHADASAADEHGRDAAAATVEPYPQDTSARREALLRGHIPTHGSGG